MAATRHRNESDGFVKAELETALGYVISFLCDKIIFIRARDNDLARDTITLTEVR